MTTILADADRVAADELRFERLLPAPVETVWEYLVDPALRARWFMGGAIDPRPGGEIEMVMDHDTLSDDDVPMPEKYAAHRGARWCERITRIDPPRLIAFTWDEGKAGEVTITLAAEGAGTRLTLVHAGLRGRDDAINFGGGWTSHLAVLAARIAGRGVPDFWALHADAERAVAARLS